MKIRFIFKEKCKNLNHHIWEIHRPDCPRFPWNLASEYLHLILILFSVKTFNDTRKYFPAINVGTAILQKTRAVHSSSFTCVSVFIKGTYKRNDLDDYEQSAKIVRIFFLLLLWCQVKNYKGLVIKGFRRGYSIMLNVLRTFFRLRLLMAVV